jgi:hypothetical protein
MASLASAENRLETVKREVEDLDMGSSMGGTSDCGMVAQAGNEWDRSDAKRRRIGRLLRR